MSEHQLDKGTADYFAPGFPDGYAGFRGLERLGRSRIDFYLTEISLHWTKENLALRTKLSNTGNYGGSVCLNDSLNGLARLTEAHIDQMLDEIAKAVRTRGKIWYRLHEYAVKRLDEHFSTAADQAVSQMWAGGEEGRQIADGAVDRMTNRAIATISLHAAGWTAPPPDSLEDRYPIWSKVGLAVFAFALGLMSQSLIQFF
ncbi:MAG: hypothetical protein AAGB23_07595 [Pseudomonadota bacterium]